VAYFLGSDEESESHTFSIVEIETVDVIVDNDSVKRRE
jgi:hypothetical protein